MLPPKLRNVSTYLPPSTAHLWLDREANLIVHEIRLISHAYAQHKMSLKR